LSDSGYIAKDLQSPVSDDFIALLRRDGVLCDAGAKLTPLSDGISSEIFRVDDGGRTFIVKRALPRLRVRDEWLANVDRNRYERMFIAYVAGFLPQAVPALLPAPQDRGYFAMECLGIEFTNWKRLLLRGEAKVEDALKAATILGSIHARSAGDAEIAAAFATTPNFTELRIDPYLLTTGNRHSELRALFHGEADRLAATQICLVHGDFSPKNIMVSASRFVLLDCEVAWYGDPAFDLAFLFTHLLLKGLYHAPRATGLPEMSRAIWLRYVEIAGKAVDCAALERRVAKLLPMLLLARVDGKSPVEYLDQGRQQFVRQFTRDWLRNGDTNLGEWVNTWFAKLEQIEA